MSARVPQDNEAIRALRRTTRRRVDLAQATQFAAIEQAEAIRAARLAGVSVGLVSELTGLSAPRIFQITGKTRKPAESRDR